MRVVSGKARGTKLFSPKDYNVRPTADRIKESLFNILQPIVYESIVLDLFSGSGAIGIEFISRGSEKAFLVDNSKDSIDIITKNVKKCNFEDSIEIMNLDFEESILKFSRRGIKFDYVFMDPPYGKYQLSKLVNLIFNGNVLKKSGIIIIESDHEDILEINELQVKILKEKTYGRTKLILLTEV